MAKKKKVRVELRKNIAKPPRTHEWTRGFQDHGYEDESTKADERVRAKGDLSRKRTIISGVSGEAASDRPIDEVPAADELQCRRGRVLRVYKQACIVQAEDGTTFRCAIRTMLKKLATDERGLVTTGDWVWFLPARNAANVEFSSDSALPAPQSALEEGVVETVEPRRGVLTRSSRKREHVLVANVDQLVAVVSLFEPDLKPHLIDRYLGCAQRGGLLPIVCLNKADLANCGAFVPLVGSFAQLGIPVLLTSAKTGQGLERLRELLTDRATVFAGQSGVGKSSLLNALQPGLGLRVREVSEVNDKGKHTTTTAELIPLAVGGWAVDTPGVRQLELWDTRPGEVEGLFPELRPFVPLCAFPDCTHTHESRCAVQRAVARRQISPRRYHSYLGMFAGSQ